jgi:hypothetical protein
MTIVCTLISDPSVIYKAWIREQTVAAVRQSISTHVSWFLMWNVWDVVEEPLPAVNGLMEFI